jgi:hypothetical protein
MIEALRKVNMISRPFEVYAFGHTHGLNSFGLRVQGARIQIVNSGAWHRTISGDALREEQERRELRTADVLGAFSTEDLPACYGVVRIDPYDPASRPSAKAWFYRPGPGGGTYSETCE